MIYREIFGVALWIFVYFSAVRCNKFVDISEKVFKEADGLIAAYADFDSDKRTDVFVISEDCTQVDLYLAQLNAPFKKYLLIDGSSVNTTDTRITSVMPADFNGDSLTDVLVTWQPKSSAGPQNLYVDIYWGRGNNVSVGAIPTRLDQRLKDQPLVMDFNGDLVPDMFGEADDDKRYFWYFSPDKKVEREQLTNGSNPGPMPPLYNPQSSAFVDWDGDLTPDLVIASKVEGNRIQIEVWKAQDGGYMWTETIPGPDVHTDDMGMVTVADIDQSSTVDLILPVCEKMGDKYESSIYVYNHTMWIKLPITFSINTKPWNFVRPTGKQPWLLLLQMLLRAGDLNLDGYPDYLAVLRPCETDSCEQKAFVLLNKACEGDGCQSFSRTFTILDSTPIFDGDGYNDLIPSFFDTSENGKLDVFLSTYKSNKPELKAFRYTSDASSYFLKIMVVSGKCVQPCIHGDRSLGVNLPGPTTYYETVNSKGDPQAGIATQLSQSAYLSLQLPYVIYGLGQSPNAVDRLIVGVSHNTSSQVDLNRTWTYVVPNTPMIIIPHPQKSQNSTLVYPVPKSFVDLNRTWTYVVPNTQMIIIPHPQNSPQYWKSRLFMTPSTLVLLTAAALSGTFGFIILIVAGFHWKEHVEDKKEKLQEAQKFHFDAM